MSPSSIFIHYSVMKLDGFCACWRIFPCLFAINVIEKDKHDKSIDLNRGKFMASPDNQSRYEEIMSSLLYAA